MSKDNENGPGEGEDLNARDYAIGKGRPPKHTQWAPGQSGNPSGKKVGKLSTKTVVKLLEKELLQSLVIFKDRDGLERRANRLEAAIGALSKQGLQGDRRANNDLINLAFQIAKIKEDSKPAPGSLEADLAAYRKHAAEHMKGEGCSERDDESW